jgi:hypothetical protein
MKKMIATAALSAVFAMPAFAVNDISDINSVFAVDTIDATQVEVLTQQEMKDTEGAFFLHYLLGGLFHHKYQYFGGHYGHGGGYGGGHSGGQVPCGC